MNSNIVLLVLLLTVLMLSLSGQLNEMRIVGRAEKVEGIVQTKYRTVNNQLAACLIFVTDLAVDLDFRARVELVDLVNPATGQFHIYVAPNERVVTVHASGYRPLTVVLRDYGISVLESGDIYQLQLTGNKTGFVADRDLFAVQFSIQPEDVYISHNNNAPVLVRGREAQFRLGAGSHRFTFSKQGYNDRNVELSVSGNVSEPVSFERGTTTARLELQGYAVIESEPSGAKLYLNEQFVGVTPYMGQLIAGNYNYTLKMPLYNSERGSFSLSQGETVNLPKVTLVPRFGTISFRSNPEGAEILLNGSNRGKTPIESLRFDSGEYNLEMRYDILSLQTRVKRLGQARCPVRTEDGCIWCGQYGILSVPYN